MDTASMRDPEARALSGSCPADSPVQHRANLCFEFQPRTCKGLAISSGTEGACPGIHACPEKRCGQRTEAERQQAPTFFREYPSCREILSVRYHSHAEPSHG